MTSEGKQVESLGPEPWQEDAKLSSAQRSKLKKSSFC